MKVLQKEKDGKMVLELEQSAAFANALRREVLENVPTMAIHDVEIRKNGSALYEEVLAHRLGLIPLTTDLKSYEMPPEDLEEGVTSAKYHLKLTLKAKGPGVVYAEQLQSADPKVIPAQPKMPIVELLKGQEVELEATAQLGTGNEHMKFAPGYAFYGHKYTFNQKKKIDDPKEVIKNCPKGVFKVEKDKIVPVDEMKSYLWETILPHVPEGSIEVTPTDTIHFAIESWGQLSCKEIMTHAAQNVIKQVEECESLL